MTANRRLSARLSGALWLALVPCLFLFLMSPASGLAQGPADRKPVAPTSPVVTFDQADASVQQQLQDSLAELARLREEIAHEKIPLAQKLSDLENQLMEVRREYQQTTRLLDSRTLDLSNLRSEIQSRKEEKTYLSNLLGEYIRNFETRLHIAELQRYRQQLEAAKLALENGNLSETEMYQARAALVTASLECLHDALGGTRFEGSAVDASGLVKRGTFVLVGPVALFCSLDGKSVGTAEQRLGSLEPTVLGFDDPATTQAVAATVATGSGLLPLDPTLGSAHKIQATKESIVEHISKGGPVMVTIPRDATVAEAVGRIRSVGIDEDLQVVFVVDEQGRYVGELPLRLLLTQPEHVRVESLVDRDSLFVRVDAGRTEVRDLLRRHDVTTMPVLDHDNRLVGRIVRNGE